MHSIINKYSHVNNQIATNIHAHLWFRLSFLHSMICVATYNGMKEILHPSTTFRTADHCLDYFHVGDGVFNWRGHAGVVQYCLRKLVALESILVADIKQDFLDFITTLIPNFARLVRWGIEGDLDLNAARSAEDVHPLIGH